MAGEVTGKPYVREIPRVLWFLRHPRYVRYMARELSCIFIGAYAVVLVVGLFRLAQGQAAWEGFLAALGSPAGLAFHLVALGFAAYHSVTWFNLTPKALPLRLGERPVPGILIAGAHYAFWVICSATLLALAGAF
jgi:fumarate reductase subunit C